MITLAERLREHANAEDRLLPVDTTELPKGYRDGLHDGARIALEHAAEFFKRRRGGAAWVCDAADEIESIAARLAKS